MLRACLLGLLAGALWCACPAAAQPPPGTLAPPGNSGVSQYVETIPSHKGRARMRRGGEPRAGAAPDGTPGALTADTRRSLRALGSAGRGVEQLHDQSRVTPDPGQADEVVRAAQDRSGVIGTAISRSAGSGMGGTLPLLLGAIAVGGVLVWWRRRRPAEER